MSDGRPEQYIFAMGISLLIVSIERRRSKSKKVREKYLRDCWVSMKSGFLPERNVEKISSNARFDVWNDVGKELANLNRRGKIQEVVKNMPLLDIDLIQDDDELRRAYVLLGMMLQSYCKNVGGLAEGTEQNKTKQMNSATTIEQTVPRQLAIPYVALRRSLA